MKTIETTAKKGGNSIGAIIPKGIIDKENIKENNKSLRETFGLVKNKIKKSTQQIKNELRD